MEQQKKILLVDDEPSLLAALERTLSRKGYRIITAPNGQNAISLAKRHGPDLIIMDISMPGIGGEEVAAKLGEDPQTRNIPVIFLTGLFSRDQQQQRGHMIGGHIFVAKPVETEALLQIIQDRLAASAVATPDQQ